MYTSIAHWPNITTHEGGYLSSTTTVGGVTWVRLYRGTPERAEYVAQFRQRKQLAHYLTGQRFSTIERAVAHYRAQA